MEKIIMKTLLDMYVSEDLSEIVGDDINEAYTETDDIIAKFKANIPDMGEEIALDDAICNSIATGVSYGFCDGVKVGFAIANTLLPKKDVALIQKASKAVSA